MASICFLITPTCFVLAGITSGNKSKKPGPSMPAQNLVSPLQYSAMLKLYSTTADDPTNYREPEKNELGVRKGSSGSSGGGGAGSNVGPIKKSSFEGKEYSRLSTNDKDGGNGNEPETVFSSSQSSSEESDIPEPSKSKPEPTSKPESSKKSPQQENIAA